MQASTSINWLLQSNRVGTADQQRRNRDEKSRQQTEGAHAYDDAEDSPVHIDEYA